MRTSAGLLLFRTGPDGALELLLVHIGGPFWANQDAAGWSIPKGELDHGEDAHQAAVREFAEELGRPPPPGDDVCLGTVRQSSAKLVTVFARRGEFDADHITSNVVDIEWPPRSGRRMQIPEVDRARWCTPDEAREKLVRGQVPFVDLLRRHLESDHRG